MSEEELFAKTYSRFKGSNFFSIIEDGKSYLAEQATKVLEELSKPEIKKEANENYDYHYTEYLISGLDNSSNTLVACSAK